MSGLLKIMNSNWAIKRDAYTSIMEILKAHKEGPKIDLKALEAKALALNPQPQGSEPYQVIDGIAVIPVRGVLSKSPSLFERVVYGAASMTEIKTRVNHALNNGRVKSILLDVDSPGGTVDGTQELADFIYAARQVKTVFAFCDGLMASAAYWIGSAAEQIFISSGTVEVGSIGVITTHYDFSEMDKAYGVNITEIFAGKYKAAGSDVKPLSPDDKEYIQSRIDYLYSVFVEAVAKNRDTDVDTVLSQMADAKIFIGQEAITAGLVDGVSTFEAVLDKMKSGSTAGDAVNARSKNLISGDGTGTALPEVPQRTAAGAVAVESKNNQEKAMLTIEALKNDHPDLFAAVKKEIEDANAADLLKIKEDAAAAERDRIKGVADQLIPGHEELINKMMFDGKTTPGEAAMAINAEHKKAMETAQGDFSADMSAGIDRVDAPADEEKSKESADSRPLEEKAKETWEKDAKLRAEFGDNFASYISFVKAQKNGAVKIQKKEAGK